MNDTYKQPVLQPGQHYDDYAVDCFAQMMKEKLTKKRAEGRDGWNDPKRCSVQYLNQLLLEHVEKGDPVDVANFCMMLRHYNARITAQPTASSSGDQDDAAFYRGVIAALGALRPHSTHGCTVHDEIVNSVDKDQLYAIAEPEDVEWAGLDPEFYAKAHKGAA